MSSHVYFWSFFQLHNLPLFLLGKIDFQKTLAGGNGSFNSAWICDDNNLGDSFTWSKNEHIQFFDLQMYFPEILLAS